LGIRSRIGEEVSDEEGSASRLLVAVLEGGAMGRKSCGRRRGRWEKARFEVALDEWR